MRGWNAQEGIPGDFLVIFHKFPAMVTGGFPSALRIITLGFGGGFMGILPTKIS